MAMAEAARTAISYAGSIGHDPFSHVLFVVPGWGVHHGQRASSSTKPKRDYQVCSSCPESSGRSSGCPS